MAHTLEERPNNENKDDRYPGTKLTQWFLDIEKRILILIIPLIIINKHDALQFYYNIFRGW